MGAFDNLKTTTVEDLLDIVNKYSTIGKSISAQENALHKARQNSVSEASKVLDDMINNATTGAGIANANLAVNSIDTLATGNPEAKINVLANKNLITEKAQDYLNYKNQIDIGLKKYHEVVRGYGDEDWSNLTVDTITNELMFLEEFDYHLYEDPLEKKNEKKFIGHYVSNYEPKTIDTGFESVAISGGPMSDTEVIARMKSYKKSLNTALGALAGDKMITENELFFVKSGNIEGLKAERERIVKLSTSNLKSYRSSINTVKKFQKSLLQAIANGTAKEDDTVDLFGSVMLSEVNIRKELENNAHYKDMDLDTAIEELASIYEGMTYSDVIEKMNEEISDYEFLMKREGKRFKLWSGSDFEFKSTDKDDELENALKKYLKNK